MGRDRITLVPLGISGERGAHYQALHAGGVLIERTWNPEYDAARAPVAKDIVGTVEVWRPGKAHPDSTFIAEKAAKSTIRENAHEGPKLARWEPFSSGRIEPSAAVLGEARVQEPPIMEGRQSRAPRTSSAKSRAA